MTIYTLVIQLRLMDGFYDLQTKSKEHREIKNISKEEKK